jgi:aspartate/methionine/tyrosine aminotransferase
MRELSMPSRSPHRFLLERWFAEFEFMPGMRVICGSGAEPPTTEELLALDGAEATARYLSLGLDYIENPGGEGLRAAIAALHLGLSAEQIQVTTGASEAILLLIWTLVRPGDAVVVADPCYQSHGEVAAALGAEVRRLALREEDGWKPDAASLSRLVDARTRLVILNYPHNPSGAALSGDELATLIHVAEEAGAIFVSDEVFRLIALEGVPMPSATEISDRAVAIGDLSKPWGLGGLRMGWIASRDAPLLRALSEARDFTTMCSGAPSELLAEIALRHAAALLAPRLEIARANRALLADLVDRAGGALRWQLPMAGYTAWLRLPHGVQIEPFCRHLAQDRAVLLLPGTVFGPRYEGYVRIGFGGDAQTLLAGLAVLQEEIDGATVNM